ncbi:hypothetical protein M8J77_018234 [Diaphorina citri]|nr:hypothetical protein M8J77_018234 [Diaphorina citri]
MRVDTENVEHPQFHTLPGLLPCVCGPHAHGSWKPLLYTLGRALYHLCLCTLLYKLGRLRKSVLARSSLAKKPSVYWHLHSYQNLVFTVDHSSQVIIIIILEFLE